MTSVFLKKGAESGSFSTSNGSNFFQTKTYTATLLMTSRTRQMFAPLNQLFTAA